jgi:hypothetical protein
MADAALTKIAEISVNQQAEAAEVVALQGIFGWLLRRADKS